MAGDADRGHGHPGEAGSANLPASRVGPLGPPSRSLLLAPILWSHCASCVAPTSVGSGAHTLLATLAHRAEWLGDPAALSCPRWVGGCSVGSATPPAPVGRALDSHGLQDVTALKDKDPLVRGWEPRAGRKTEGAASGEGGGLGPQSGGVWCHRHVWCQDQERRPAVV